MGLIDRDEVSYASFRTDAADRWRIEVEATSLAYTVFAGPTPLEALARFSVRSGRQPMPERWWFGLWYQSGHANRVPLERPSIEWRVLAEVLSPFGASSTRRRLRHYGTPRCTPGSRVG